MPFSLPLFSPCRRHVAAAFASLRLRCRCCFAIFLRFIASFFLLDVIFARCCSLTACVDMPPWRRYAVMMMRGGYDKSYADSHAAMLLLMPFTPPPPLLFRRYFRHYAPLCAMSLRCHAAAPCLLRLPPRYAADADKTLLLTRCRCFRRLLILLR